MVELSLARDFPPADEAAWKALVEEALKGAPFASLRSKTYDGIAIEPLYPRAREASRIEGRAAGPPWAVMQRIDLPDPKAANAQILDDLNNGASGVDARVSRRDRRLRLCAARDAAPRSAPRSTISISMPASPSISISASSRRTPRA